MRAYLFTTATIFGLLTIVHAWRVVEEGGSIGRDPWFLIITIVAAALCVWAVRLIRRLPRA